MTGEGEETGSSDVLDGFLHLAQLSEGSLGDSTVALLIVHVFNDLILHLSARSVQRIELYGHRLVKELPKRARLFSLGVPKFDNPMSVSNEFLEDTEEICRSFILSHPLTANLRRHAAQLVADVSANPPSRVADDGRRLDGGDATDLLVATVPLPSSACPARIRKSKRSFSTAFPVTPCWMLTPCTATSPLINPDGANVPSSSHSSNPSRYLPVPSPCILGTPGFYSLCRRFGTFQEQSTASKQLTAGHQSEHLLSNVMAREVVINNVLESEEQPPVLSHMSPRATRNMPHAFEDFPPTAPGLRKIGDPSWSPIPGSPGTVRSRIANIERKTPGRILSTKPWASFSAKRGGILRASRPQESCATPRGHVADPMRNEDNVGEAAAASHFALPVTLAHRSATNPPESFGATPIPVRKSVSTAQDTEALPSPLSSPHVNSSVAQAVLKETEREVMSTQVSGIAAPDRFFVTPTEQTASTLGNVSLTSSCFQRMNGDSSLAAASSEQLIEVLQKTHCVETTNKNHDNVQMNSAPFTVEMRPELLSVVESTGLSHKERQAGKTEGKMLPFYQSAEKTTVEVVVEADEDQQAKNHQKLPLDTNSKTEAIQFTGAKNVGTVAMSENVVDPTSSMKSNSAENQPCSPPSILKASAAVVRPCASELGVPAYTRGANRDLLALVYPATRDEAVKAVREVPDQVMSVKFREADIALTAGLGTAPTSSLDRIQTPASSAEPDLSDAQNRSSISNDENASADPSPAAVVLSSDLPTVEPRSVRSSEGSSQATSVAPSPNNSFNQSDADILDPCSSVAANTTVLASSLAMMPATPPPPALSHHQAFDELKRMSPRLQYMERRMHRTLKKIPPKNLDDQADLSGEEDNPRVKLTGRKEASWAKNTKDWFRMVREQLDIDPLSIFGCGVKPVLFEDIFQTPDFRRAAKDIMDRNDPLRQRAPDLLCQEARHKQAKKWYQDEKLCGFREHEGVSKEDVAKFRRRVGRLKDVSSLVWDSTWIVCDHSCDHDSSLRQPWFQKLTVESSPLYSSGRFQRTTPHMASGTRRFMSPLPLNRAELPGVEEEDDQALANTTVCGTPEGYTRGIFCTTGPSPKLFRYPPLSTHNVENFKPGGVTQSALGSSSSMATTHLGASWPHIKPSASTATGSDTGAAPPPHHDSATATSCLPCPSVSGLSSTAQKDLGAFRPYPSQGRGVALKDPAEAPVASKPTLKSASLSLFSKFRGKG